MVESLPPESPARTGKAKLPRGVTFLTMGVLTIAGFYAARLVLALLRWQELDQLPGVRPGYIVGVSLVWAVTAAGLWRGLRLRKTWAPQLTRLAVIVYSGFSWLERLFTADNRNGSFFGLQLQYGLPVNWPFLLFLDLVGILFVFWILSRRQVKEIFGEFHERKP
jgi:hypothetical protein